jgi:hypothetical protein
MYEGRAQRGCRSLGGEGGWLDNHIVGRGRTQRIPKALQYTKERVSRLVQVISVWLISGYCTDIVNP